MSPFSGQIFYPEDGNVTRNVVDDITNHMETLQK
jgi:hypothetical protein